MTLNAVTIGDSIAWGQGLPEDQKFDRRAVAEMARRLGLPEDDWKIDRRARSGAVIKEEDTEPPLDPSRHPSWREVPWGSPTAMQQLEGAPDPDVDLVIAVAGLNDFGITSVLAPDISREDLEADIRRNCYVDAKAMVRRARDRFPQAVIVLCGYFAPFSEASGLTMIRAVASGLGPSRLITEATTRRVARQARLFARRQLYWLRLVVAERQADPATRGPGIAFAHPAFGPRNSVGAPEALLFSPDPPDDIEKWGARLVRDPLAAGLRLHPDDPMSEERRAACAAYRDRVQEHMPDAGPLQCRIAAIGHPDPEGAARYRDAALRAWERARRITLRDDLERITFDRDGLSLRGSLAGYVIDPAEGAPNHRMHLGDIRRLTLALHITGALPEGDWKPKRIWVEVNGIPVHHETIDKHLSVTVTDGEDAWTASWPRAAA